MKNSRNHRRVIILAVASILLTTAAFFTVSLSRAAVESVTHVHALNPANNENTAATSDSGRAGVMRANDAYGKLPLSFEPNRGQTDPGVVFISRGSGSTLFLTSTGAVLALKDPHKKAIDPANALSSRVPVTAIGMEVVGANPASEIIGLERLPGNSNYFRGNDPSRWRSNVPTYARVQYKDIYPGVNLVYYGNDRQLEYDFEVAPGANPGVIRLALKGVKKITLGADGALVLVLRKAGIELRLQKPSVYQQSNGEKQPVAGRYVVKGRQIRFEIGDYDKSRALVIDPVLTYSTFLGGTSDDYGRSIAIDSGGNAYVTGQTYSFNFPVTINGYSTTYANGNDVFVTKLNADGSAIVYSTYLGGNSDDIGYGIALDSSGNAYVTGSTGSTNYPTTPGAYQTTLHGSSYYNADAFVTKLNMDGTALVYSTYLGGSNAEQANGIAIDSSGNAYLAGYTYSNDFPTTPGAFKTTISAANSQDAFVTKLNDTGTALVYSTFLGGSGADQATAIKVDSSGYAYVTGMTASANFDVTPGAYQTTYGGASSSYYNAYGDAFATKFHPTGASLIYSTYIGGAGDDAGFGIDLASSGEVYLTGSTSSGNFPTTSGVVRVGNGGIAKSTNGADSWYAANSGVTNSTELSLAINPSNPSIVFVGSSGGGVFRSTNGGASWAAVNSGLTDLTVRALTIDPMTTSLMYLGTSSRGVFRSTDGGTTWRAINTGQNGMTVNIVQIDPVTSSTIYAGTSNGVFKTTNGGASWAAANSGLNQGLTVNALAVDPTATSTLFAGIGYYGGGVFKSTNGGVTWTGTSLSGTNITALALDPSAHSTIYAGTGNGVQKSTDGGANWRGVNAGLANWSVNALALSPADTATIYAGTGNGIFKSTNGGTAWNPGNNGLAGAVVNALAVDPVTALTLYCGSASGSTDAFVTKLNGTGTALVYSTYLGGSSSDQAASVAIDTSGNAYVTGTTASQNFPIVRGGFELFGGYGNDAFVTKLSPTGAALVYSTYLGGSNYDYGYGVVVDSSGSAYVTGYTQSQNFPTTAGAFQSVGGGYSPDAFITKVAVLPSLTADLGITMTPSAGPFTAGSNVVYNITLTNNGPERASSIVVTDELPASLLFNNCYGSPYPYCSHIGNSATFTFSSLDVGASINLQISATVSCSIGSSVMIANTVMVDSFATDPNTSDNSATATITATNSSPTLSPTNQFFASGGGSASVSVNWSSGCNWTSMSNASWITITYSSNCCNGVVNYSVAANPGSSRQGTMTIAGQTFFVNQGSGCTFSIDHASKSFVPAGGTDSVAVTTSDASCNWAATSNATFITITSGGSGAGNGSVNYSVDANQSAIPRSGTMTIAGQTFTVSQGGVPCSYSLSPASASVGPAGGNSSFGVTSPNGCNWTAVRNDSWITVTSGASGTGNGTVNYSVASNVNVSSRTGSITVAGQTFTVNQSGIAAVGLSYQRTNFDNDVKTDLGFYRSGLWGFLKSSQSYSTGSPQFFNWGGAGLQPICADFDGDGKADIAYMVPPSGGQSAAYAILLSSRGYSFAAGQPLFVSAGFPSLGDTPVVGDFDGDGKADPGIWRATQGVWMVPKSSSNYTSFIVTQWGQLGDIPVIADFDGDGKADIGFYRDGVWGVLKSSQSYSTGSALFFNWGGAGLQPIVGDFDGDGKADIGYMVPPSGGQSASYAILLSSRGYSFAAGQPLFVPAGFPSLGDTPVVGDFDGDGKADPGVWRESQGVWMLPLSSSNYASFIVVQWGQTGDIAFPNSTGRHQ